MRCASMLQWTARPSFTSKTARAGSLRTFRRICRSISTVIFRARARRRCAAPRSITAARLRRGGGAPRLRADRGVDRARADRRGGGLHRRCARGLSAPRRSGAPRRADQQRRIRRAAGAPARRRDRRDRALPRAFALEPARGGEPAGSERLGAPAIQALAAAWFGIEIFRRFG